MWVNIYYLFLYKKGMHMDKLEILCYWCNKVIPLVYDDSLSYYEVLCKVKNKLNEVIESQNTVLDIVSDLAEHEAEVDALLIELRSIIDELNSGALDAMLEVAISKAIKMVWFGLTLDGYFVAYIPSSWNEIIFNTTGYDINLAAQPEYGHLVLSY